MKPVVWLDRARWERTEAIDYIAQDAPLAAVGQLDEINTQAERLGEFPEIGRPGRKRGTRELVVARTPFVLVYRVRAERIEVLRLLHGAQRWP